MKSTIKPYYLLLFTFYLLLFNCSTGNESAVISISFGSSTVPGKAAVSVDQLQHVITLSGLTGTQTHTVKGAGTVKATVFPGTWRINVAAYIGDELYAVGSGSTEVKAGKTSNVSIQMTVVWTDSVGVSGVNSVNGNGMVTIYLGGTNSSIMGWPYQPSQYSTFKYTIAVKDSSGEEQIQEDVMFGSAAYFNVSSGNCDVSIYAYDSAGNELMAVGFASAGIYGGSNSGVTMEMRMPLMPIKEQTGARTYITYGTITITKGALQPGKYDDFDVLADPINSSFSFINWVESDDITGNILYNTPNLSSIAINKNTSMYAVFDGDGSSPLAPENVASVLQLSGMGTSGHYALMADMDLNSLGPGGWMPIGDSIVPFTGSFDGRGHNVDLGTGVVSLSSDSSVSYAGLFGYIDSGVTVKNFSLKGEIDVTVLTNSLYAGAVAGKNEGTIENVSSSVDVKATNNQTGYGVIGDANSGGITGVNTGTISNCYSTGPVHSTANADGGGNANAEAGGIAYNGNTGTMDHCWASGNISATSSNGNINQMFAGGITGSQFGTVTQCVALNANVSVSDSAYVARVGYDTSSAGIYALNYANEDMILDDGTGSPGTGVPSSPNGANVSLSEAGQMSWWNTWYSFGGGESTPWMWDSINKLPMLWFESAVNK